jgi:hypothetical protein
MYSHQQCRETLQYSYNYYLQNYNKTLAPDSYYFCHSHRNQKIQELLTQNCLNMCKDLWKDIPCEIVKFNEIDSQQVKEYSPKNTYSTNYNNLSLVKVDSIVNPVDLSIILWCAWYGIKSLRGKNRKYYILKKCSDLIPDLYPAPEISGWYNGPTTFMSAIFCSYGNRELRTKVEEVLDAQKYKKIINPNITVNIREALA